MRRQGFGNAAGFSLVELMIAMAVTLAMMTLASRALMECFNVRSRQNSRSDTIADVQRALNIISREVASAGFGLTNGNNGIVGCNPNCDSNAVSIRVRSNINRFDITPSDADTSDDNEDVKFFLNESANTRYLVRYNANAAGATPKATVLANRITALQFHYFDRRVTYTTLNYDPANAAASLLTNVRNSDGVAQAEVAPNLAKYVVIVVVVRLPAVGRPDTPGYHPASNEMLVSDVALRNNDMDNY